MSSLSVGVQCGRCGSGPVYMVTCNSFYGTGHEWVLASLCDGCRHVSWTDERCLSCDGRDPLNEGRSPHRVPPTPQQIARAYRDLRAVLEATWPPKARWLKRLRHREAIRRLVEIARAAGVDPEVWRRQGRAAATNTSRTTERGKHDR